jgi:hypothetical protein
VTVHVPPSHLASNAETGSVLGQSRRSEHGAHLAAAHVLFVSSSFAAGTARGAAGQHAQHPAASVTTQSASDVHDT